MRLAVMAAVMLAPSVAGAETISLYAAGSLRGALTEVAQAFEAKSGEQHKVATTFGPSGLLRQRIEGGEAAHVFASANTSHPQSLADSGRASPPVRVFARNQLCALVRSGLDVSSDKLLDVMLSPDVRVGTSTPKADPAGDYAYALFAKAETLKPGSRAALEAKALQLTGGPSSERPPEKRNAYGWVMEQGKADLFLTYCTNAVAAKSQVPQLAIVQVPKNLSVGASYGMVVVKDAPAAAKDLADFIASPQGQAILEKYGFGAGD